MPKSAKHECAICLEEVVEIANKRILACGHTFHSKCVCKWLQRKHTCPLCRKRVPKPPQDDARIAFMFALAK